MILRICKTALKTIYGAVYIKISMCNKSLCAITEADVVIRNLEFSKIGLESWYLQVGTNIYIYIYI